MWFLRQDRFELLSGSASSLAYRKGRLIVQRLLLQDDHGANGCAGRLTRLSGPDYIFLLPCFLSAAPWGAGTPMASRLAATAGF